MFKVHFITCDSHFHLKFFFKLSKSTAIICFNIPMICPILKTTLGCHRTANYTDNIATVLLYFSHYGTVINLCSEHFTHMRTSTFYTLSPNNFELIAGHDLIPATYPSNVYLINVVHHGMS